MSLLNKMLHDLEQRRADAAGPVIHREIRPLPAAGEPPFRLAPVAGLLLVIAAGAAAWFLLGGGGRHPAPALPPQVAEAALPELTLAAPAPAADSGQSSPMLAVAGSSPAARTVSELKLDAGLRLSDRLSIPDTLASTTANPVVPAGRVEPSSPPAVSPAPVAPAGKPAVEPLLVAVGGKPTAGSDSRIEKRELEHSPRDQAERLYRSGVAQWSQGREQDGVTTLRAALRENPEHLAARQQLIKWHIDRRAFDVAQGELEEGLQRLPKQTAWAMLLSRLRVDRGDAAGALAVLQRHEPHAGSAADYQAAMAAVLQRLDRHAEAETKFVRATQVDAANGRWWVGLGLAREAQGKGADAREAFRSALSAGNLSAELRAFAEEKAR